MMLEKIGNKDNKYEVKITHFFCLEYLEGDHTMTVEIDFRDPTLLLSVTAINSWNTPFENEEISEYKKQTILINIYNYLTNNGFNQIEVVR